MEIVLKFDASDPDDKDEYKRLMKANDMASLLWELQQFIREQIKFCENEDFDKDIFVKKFRDLCDEQDINIYDLWG